MAMRDKDTKNWLSYLTCAGHVFGAYPGFFLSGRTFAPYTVATFRTFNPLEIL